MELNFSFDTDIEQVVAALDKTLAELANVADIKPYLLAAPEIFGWNAINEWSVVVRLSAKVMVGKQSDVARSMRHYALKALQEAGITVESYYRGNSKPGKK